jgi:hypothetical protein
MNKLLWLAAAILIFVGPIMGVYLGIHPGILPFLGIACGLVAVVRGTRALPDIVPDGDAPSTGAEADARILSHTSVNYSPKSGTGITDVGGVP